MTGRRLSTLRAALRLPPAPATGARARLLHRWLDS